ncbi:hypothetical protein [Methanothermococcus thermolithotrophicus]|uniref:hypothetical protein n=1 Tax=Methanothermococcus thermolithotrophicus TaxID=2186 RepID=UPI000364BA72|nr:hypothetical protein [Methanothermococcus thermolithotrophicus]
MERNITIGLVIALVLTSIGAFWMSSHSSEGGGFLIDFLQNSNTTTADNSTTNNTYLNDTYTNSTINNTSTDNSTVNETVTDDNSTTLTLSFLTVAVFDNSTNSSIISLEASETNITVDNILLFTSYDNINFTEAASLTNTTLPTTITVPVNTTYSEIYYYLEVLYNNTTYRVPTNGTEVLNISGTQ